MKKFVTGMLLFVATAAFAADTENATATARRDAAVRDRAIAMGHTSGGFSASAVHTSKAEDWVFIPAAASSAGSRGTFYRSDIMIANFRSVSQRVRARWIPQNQSGFGTNDVFLTIPANAVVAFPDFVGSTLHYSGLGAIELVARDANDSIDLSAKIDAFSRIWTPQPGSTLGSVSQNFGSNYIFQIEGTAPAYALGLRQDNTYRTNIGILNIDFFSAHTWQVSVIATGGNTSMDVTVPAFSMAQVNLPAGNWGDLSVTFTPDSKMTDEDWMAYGTTSDNGTNDGWVSVATQTGQ